MVFAGVGFEVIRMQGKKSTFFASLENKSLEKLRKHLFTFTFM